MQSSNIVRKIAFRLVRLFLNRQRANEEAMKDHGDKGTVMSASLHVPTADIKGSGPQILRASSKPIRWPLGRATALLFAWRQLTHKTLKVTAGTDYGFVFFFDLEDITNGDKAAFSPNTSDYHLKCWRQRVKRYCCNSVTTHFWSKIGCTRKTYGRRNLQTLPQVPWVRMLLRQENK